MKKQITVRRVFVESYAIEATETGDFMLWFDRTAQENLTEFRAEALEIGRALFKDLPVTWIAFDQQEGMAHYRARTKRLGKLLRIVFERAI